MRINKLITLECMIALSQDGMREVAKILNKFNFKQLYLILEIDKLNGINAIKLFLRKIDTLQYSAIHFSTKIKGLLKIKGLIKMN